MFFFLINSTGSPLYLIFPLPNHHMMLQQSLYSTPPSDIFYHFSIFPRTNVKVVPVTVKYQEKQMAAMKFKKLNTSKKTQ